MNTKPIRQSVKFYVIATGLIFRLFTQKPLLFSACPILFLKLKQIHRFINQKPPFMTVITFAHLKAFLQNKVDVLQYLDDFELKFNRIYGFDLFCFNLFILPSNGLVVIVFLIQLLEPRN